MPSIDVVNPVSSAPTDRLALGVGWVRPGAGAIDGGLNPSLPGLLTAFTGFRFTCAWCFEGNEE